MSGLQQQMVTVMQQQKHQQQQQQQQHQEQVEHMMNAEIDNNIESKISHSYDIDKQSFNNF